MVRVVVGLFFAAISLISAQELKPKNIIILIGDGMGINYVGANLLQDKNSPFYQFTTTGFSITCSADHLITDSAAGATALATGYLTKNKYISVDTLGNPLYTLFELAEKLNLSTGIVVTASVAHATPGAFVAHSISRYDQTLIASQMIEKDIDIVIGGGLKYFIPKNDSGEREDNKDLTKELINKNYIFTKNYPDLKSIPDSIKQIYALFADDGLPEASKRNYSLGDLTKAALTHLKNDSDGFVLMIEGSQIDWAGHDHKSQMLIDEMKDFSTAIKEALDFARQDKNTLVVVTSDHETGGMSIIKTNNSVNDLEPELELGYTSTGHTPSPVGIFAFGPGEELFKGIMNINHIGQKLFYLLDPSIKF
jgi:alkaline phosphatase